MKNRILSAALTALAFAGCNDPKTPEAKITPKPPATEVAIAARKPDAGQLTQVEPKVEAPTDALAIAHDQPKIDHLDRAKQLKTDGDFAGALTEARRALYNDAENEDVLQFIAKIAPRTGQHGLSAQAWGRIAEQREDDATPLIAQTRELITARDFKQATITGRDAVRRDPQNVEAWQALGRAHLSIGDLPSAIVAFEKAVELNPTHGYALNNLGLAYLRANENPSAAQVLERAAEQLPNISYVQNNLGVAYERLGRVDEAKEAYSRATALSPKYVKAKINADRVAKVQVTPEQYEEPTPDDANAVPETTSP